MATECPSHSTKYFIELEKYPHRGHYLIFSFCYLHIDHDEYVDRRNLRAIGP